MNPVRLFLKYLGLYRKHVVYVLIYSLVNGIITLIIPFSTQLLITFISTGVVFASWYVLVVLLGIAIIFNGILQVYQLTITENLQQNLFRNIGLNLHNRILKGVFTEKNATEIANHFYEAILLQKAVPKVLIDLPTAVLQILLGFLLISYYHSFFAFLVVVMLLVTYLAIRSISSKTFKVSVEESEHKYATLHWLQIKGNDEESTTIIHNPFSWKKIDSYISKYLRKRNEHFRMLKQHYITLIIVKVIITLTLMFLGGVLVGQGTITFGQFVASELIILIMIAAVEKIIFTVDVIYDMLTNIYKIEKILTIKEYEEIPLPEFDIHFPLTIEFKDVVINIDGYETHINETLHLEQGEQKKSSLQLLEYLYFILHKHKAVVKSGELLFNGINILKVYYDHHDMLFINRHDQLFKGTIRENICLTHNISDMELIEWLQYFGIWDTIQHLEYGLDTIITHESILSDRFTYKVILLRTLLVNPTLLIVNNIFSYLDDDFIYYFKSELSKRSITLIYS